MPFRCRQSKCSRAPSKIRRRCVRPLGRLAYRRKSKITYRSTRSWLADTLRLMRNWRWLKEKWIRNFWKKDCRKISKLKRSSKHPHNFFFDWKGKIPKYSFQKRYMKDGKALFSKKWFSSLSRKKFPSLTHRLTNVQTHTHARLPFDRLGPWQSQDYHSMNIWTLKEILISWLYLMCEWKRK